MKRIFRRLRVLCEDHQTRLFVQAMVEKFGIGARNVRFDVSPNAKADAAKFVMDHFIEAVRDWRSSRHGTELVGLLIVIDGDKHGTLRRRTELLKRLREARLEPILDNDPVAIIVPTWHIETWIGWLCGHRPILESQRYKLDETNGRDVAQRIESGEYSARRAINAWNPPADDERTCVPSLSDARKELKHRFGI